MQGLSRSLTREIIELAVIGPLKPAGENIVQISEHNRVPFAVIMFMPGTPRRIVGDNKNAQLVHNNQFIRLWRLFNSFW